MNSKSAARRCYSLFTLHEPLLLFDFWFFRLNGRRLPAWLPCLVARFRIFHFSRAEAAFSLDIETFRERRNSCRLAAQLTRFPQNNLCVAVVFLDVAMNLDNPAFQLANIANVPKISSEHHNLEGTGAVVFAEVKKSGARFEAPDFGHFAGDALGRANVTRRVGEGNAFRGGERCKEKNGDPS